MATSSGANHKRISHMVPVAGTVVAVLSGVLVSHDTVLAILLAIVVAVMAMNQKQRMARATLWLLVALMPFHGLLLEVGVPAWWKEALTASLLVMAPRSLLRAHRSKLFWPISAFVGVTIASAALAGRWAPLDLGPYLFFVPLAFSLPVIIESKRQLNRLAFTALIGVLANAAVVIAAQVQGQTIMGISGAANSSGAHLYSWVGPRLLSATLIGTAAAAMFAVAHLHQNNRNKKLVAYAVAGYLAVAVICTLSRGAFVALITGVAVTLALGMLRRGSSSKLFAAALIVAGLMIAGAGLLHLPGSSIYVDRFTAFGISNDASNSTRLQRWTATGRMAADAPVLGNGPGATGQSRLREELPNATYYPDSIKVPISESNWLKILAEIGVLGAAAAAAVVGTATRTLWRASAQDGVALVALITLIVLVVHGATFQSMEAYIGAFQFWAVVGLSVAYEQAPSACPRKKSVGASSTSKPL